MTEPKCLHVKRAVQREALVACLIVRADTMRWRGGWVGEGRARRMGAVDVAAHVLGMDSDELSSMLDEGGMPPWRVSQRREWAESEADEMVTALYEAQILVGAP